MRIGVLSDTHGRLPQSAIDAFKHAEVDRIIHAGDFEDARQLAPLQAIAPTIAVRGNNDYRSNPPKVVRFVWEGVCIHVAHRPEDLLKSIYSEPSEEPVLGIHGHLHVPKYDDQGAMTIASPGSPIYPRGMSEPSVLILEIENGMIRHWFIEV
jgi:putative phosphoesterase